MAMDLLELYSLSPCSNSWKVSCWNSLCGKTSRGLVFIVWRALTFVCRFGGDFCLHAIVGGSISFRSAAVRALGNALAADAVTVVCAVGCGVHRGGLPSEAGLIFACCVL